MRRPGHQVAVAFPSGDGSASTMRLSRASGAARRWPILGGVCALVLACSSGAHPEGDVGADGPASESGPRACVKHVDCPQTYYCYYGTCLQDPELRVYHCGKKDSAGNDSCPPGRWCVGADGARSRCAPSHSYRCETACDCGPAHCCLEVPGLGRRCIKDTTDPWLPGGDSASTVHCKSGQDATYCAGESSCRAGRHAYTMAGIPERFRATDPQGGVGSSCGGASCFGTSCHCEPGQSCVDTLSEAPRADRSCALLAGGSCVTNAVAEAVFGYAPTDLLACCSSDCPPGERCDAGWISDRQYAYRRVVGRCGSCGNGRCDEGEYPGTCPQDCRCGDGVCQPEEAGQCDADCGGCGDAICAAGEVSGLLSNVFCGDCYCGNGSCDKHDETSERCPLDCRCGDGFCSSDEVCPEDCVCPFSFQLPLEPRACGDGVCQRAHCGDRENCRSCSVDCGECQWQASVRQHATSNISASNLERLNAVWGFGHDDIYVAGSHGQILHYDGIKWQLMRTVVQNKWPIKGLWGSSRENLFAVGSSRGKSLTDRFAITRFDGQRWHHVPSEGNAALQGIWGVNARDVFAVGEGGAILRYDGESFVRMASGTKADLFGIWGVSANDLHAVGDGVVLRFDGKTWRSSQTSGKLYAVWGSSKSNVVAVGDGGLIVRFDGTTWRPFGDVPTTMDLRGVGGNGDNDVVVVGAGGAIFRYNGIRWQQAASPTRWGLSAIWRSRQITVVVGDGGILSDHGSGWREATPPTTQRLRAIWGHSAKDVFVIGSRGTILRGDGDKWRASHSGTDQHLNAIWGSSADDVMAVGTKGIITHFDGKTWRPMPTPTAEALHGVWGSSPSDVFAVGGDSGTSGVILHFDGRAWKNMTAPKRERSWLAVWGSSADNVFAVSSQGTIARYDGVRWSEGPSMVRGGLRSIWGSSKDRIFAIGADSVLRFDGWRWYPEVPPKGILPNSLSQVWGLSANDVYLVGSSGGIIHYDGVAWKPVAVDLRRPEPVQPAFAGWGCQQISGIWGGSKDELLLVGDLGAIVRLSAL